MAGNLNEWRLDADDDNRFMAEAIRIRRNSENPVRKVGACIVNRDKQIIGVGYNNWHNIDNLRRENQTIQLEQTYHAETMAILNSGNNVEGCALYVTFSPCETCITEIIQSRLREVIYRTENDNIESLRERFDKAGIGHRQYI